MPDPSIDANGPPRTDDSTDTPDAAVIAASIADDLTTTRNERGRIDSIGDDVDLKEDLEELLADQLDVEGDVLVSTAVDVTRVRVSVTDVEPDDDGAGAGAGPRTYRLSEVLDLPE